MLTSLIVVILGGFFAGQLTARLRIPALVGMIVIGTALGPQGQNWIHPDFLALADPWRTLAVMVILMKAGLGLDAEKLAQQGTVALRLGFLPAACEAVVVAFAAMGLLGFDFAHGLLLGCIIGAESPAVIVPAMLRLKSLGWGVAKGIPDAILMGSALSDVLLLLVFSLLVTFLSQGAATGFRWGIITLSPVQALPFQMLTQISLGILIGWAWAQMLVLLLARQNWAQSAVQEALVAAGLALLLVVLAETLPIFSGYLAVMATGFFLIALDAPLARRLRHSFDGLWAVAQIGLFVLLGASLRLDVLGNMAAVGLLILAVGTLVGRGLGWFLSTLGSNWTWKERLFLLPGNSAKATVQAAIGAVPLSLGLAGGETMLALAALSILITAPLGAWAIPTFAPRLLDRGEVDPTKVSVAQKVLILAAVDTSPLAPIVLAKAAELARRSEREVIVLHVRQVEDPQGEAQIYAQAQQYLADIRHQVLIQPGVVAETILNIAQTYSATEILIGKRGHRPLAEVILGSVSQTVLETSPIPVLVLEAKDAIAASPQEIG
ncbi:cation:proton antiporter [Phormidium sp. FACHB-1136]|uniref:cation:proton antiporter n=1 Tax=Phormidium sp. FACHB-1136 TaxID=2692848 RepID=UPI0016860D34|nr:cation:proton antiporter [Phormidium sp. FACHB-1136]MBD2427029.1 cation:proton antiporter [Phormidium sp. FACHB-1136]